MLESGQASPEMQRLIANLQSNGLPVSTPQEAYMVIFQPQNYGLSERQMAPFQQAWLGLEALYSEQIAQYLYMNLLQKSQKANKLDIAAMKRDHQVAATLQVAKKPFGQLDEKTYPVSDAEIQKAYEANKEKYAIPETMKEISFIEVSVPASQGDLAEATAIEQSVIVEMGGTTGISRENQKKGVNFQRLEMPVSYIKDPMVKNFVTTSTTGEVKVISKNDRGFKVGKINKTNSAADSIYLSTIQVVGDKAMVNKVLAYANSGANLDSINNTFSVDSVRFTSAQATPLYSENGQGNGRLGLQETVFESLYNSNGSYVVLQEMDGGTVLGTVTKTSAPVEVVEYEVAEYEIHPSENTLAAARQKLEKFVATNNTASKFVKNAKAANYNPIDITLSPSSPAVPNQMGGLYPDSRALVRWVIMDGKDGEVSKVYQTKDAANPKLYVAAVIDTYKEYVPWNNKKVKEELTAQVRREKAGKAMAAQYAKHGNVQAAASAMGVEPVVVEKLTGAKRDMTVTDNKVKGKILGTQKTNQYQVIPGDDGVYAVIITGIGNEAVELTDEQLGQAFLNMHRFDVDNALRGTKKIENNIYKFEQGE